MKLALHFSNYLIIRMKNIPHPYAIGLQWFILIMHVVLGSVNKLGSHLVATFLIICRLISY